MTIEIQAPDGSVVEFPDGTPDAEMAQAMQKTFGGPSAPAGMTRGPTGKLAPTMTFNADTGPVQAADDIVRLIANGASFGYADKLAGSMNGTGTDAERARSAEAGNRAGLAGKVAEIGGAAATPIAAGRMGLSLVGALGSGALKGATGLFARTGLAATEGAGYGALGASGHDTDISDGALLGAVFGAGGNLAAEGVTNAASAIAGTGRGPAPSMADVTARRDAAYQAADNSGVVYSPQAADRLRTDVVQKLADYGYDPALQPGAAPALRRIEDLIGQNVTLKGLDTVRKVANHGYKPGEKSNNAAVNMVVGAIDDLINNPAAGDVLTGSAPAAAGTIREARDLARRAIKSSEVDDAVIYAGRRAASTGKGANIDNATRQNIRHILDRGARGYTPDEVAALEKIVFGTPVQNVLRWAGGFSPQNILNGGVGMGAGGAVGGAVGGPAGALLGGAAVAGLGGVSKMVADRMTRGSVNDLIDIIMRGGQRAPLTPTQNAILGSRDALARGAIGVAANDQTRPRDDEIKRAVMRSAGRP